MYSEFQKILTSKINLIKSLPAFNSRGLKLISEKSLTDEQYKYHIEVSLWSQFHSFYNVLFFWLICNIYVFIKHCFAKDFFWVTGNWQHFSFIFPFDWSKSFSFTIRPVKHIATDDWQSLRRGIVSQLL